MRIVLRGAFHEGFLLRQLNLLARESARQMRENPGLPLLYDSGVVYRREEEETWCDALNTLSQGHEDCDGLSIYRCGELLARGAKALRQGDPGFRELAGRKGLKAEVMMTSRVPKGGSGLYHCIVRYWIGNQRFQDDPSARLGMRRGALDPIVTARWKARGVTPLLAPLEA